MPDLSFIADSLDGEGDINWDIDLERFDLDGDGQITAADCPYEYGSAESKLWWNNVLVPYVESQITPDMVSKYGDKVVGSYMGKPLVPGEAGAGQGDFQFLVDKVRITKGLSWSSAKNIAGAIKAKHYG